MAAAVSARVTVACRTRSGSRYIVLEGRTARHRLLVRETGCSGLGGYLLPGDDCLMIRIAATAAFHEPDDPCSPAKSARQLQPTTYQRFRLERMLAVLDAFQVSPGSRPSLRDLADEVLHLGEPDSSAIEWKSSSRRRQVQRIAAEASRLARSGYRELLNSEMAKR